VSKLEFVVGATAKGPRPTLAAHLREHAQVSWSRAQTLCERGKVSVDGEIVLDPSRRVGRGARVELDERRPAPRPQTVPIVFEDAHLVVLDKPSGMSSVPYEKREAGTAMDAVRDAWRADGRKATETPLFVVHRIDKDTSGLIAFAKSKLAERGLQKLFRAHDVERTYLCVAHGRVGDRRIESRLVEDRGDGLRGSTRAPRGGKRAVTHVRAVEVLPDTTLCEVQLETGKTHQIRIHLAEQGHPLVGERVYVRDYLRRVGEPIPSPRLLLHAATLGFVHPITGARVSLSAPLPAQFLATLEQLRARPSLPAPTPARRPARTASAPGRRPR
jgi:23S rRNA pseudouridine1911/1915/1917 synthase